MVYIDGVGRNIDQNGVLLRENISPDVALEIMKRMRSRREVHMYIHKYSRNLELCFFHFIFSLRLVNADQRLSS